MRHRNGTDQRPVEAGPLVEAMWWHPALADDPEHRYLRDVTVRAAAQATGAAGGAGPCGVVGPGCTLPGVLQVTGDLHGGAEAPVSEATATFLDIVGPLRAEFAIDPATGDLVRHRRPRCWRGCSTGWRCSAARRGTPWWPRPRRA